MNLIKMNTPKDMPYKIFMPVHGRPIYTYMALDGLQRSTRSPFELTIIHHRTEPTMNDDIIAMFERRGVVHDVILETGEQLDWLGLIKVVQGMLGPQDEFAFLIEDDVVIEPTDECWMQAMVDAMRADPQLAMVGSVIDQSDFISPEALSQDLGRPLTEVEENVIKAGSPERLQRFDEQDALFSGHNVAGRLFGIRLAALSEETPLLDARTDRALRARGWKTASLTKVKHRHMSLLNYYDYPEYYTRREGYISNLRGQVMPAISSAADDTD